MSSTTNNSSRSSSSNNNNSKQQQQQQQQQQRKVRWVASGEKKTRGQRTPHRKQKANTKYAPRPCSWGVNHAKHRKVVFGFRSCG